MPNCSVFWCKKRSRTSSVQKDNVTFHLFPKEESIRSLWIQACGNHVTWTPKRTSTICSQHFETSCFLQLSNNRKRLKQSAVPTLKLSKLLIMKENQSINQSIVEAGVNADDSLYICRACLTTKGVLHHIFRTNLQVLLTDFTGSVVSSDDNLPPYICSCCVTRIKKSILFRNQYQEATAILTNLHSQSKLSTQNVCNLTTNFRLNLTQTEVELLSYEPEGSNIALVNIPTYVSIPEKSANSQFGTLQYITTKPKTVSNIVNTSKPIVHVPEQSGSNFYETNKTAMIKIENEPNENELSGDDEKVLYEPEIYVSTCKIEDKKKELHNSEMNDNKVFFSKLNESKANEDKLCEKELDRQYLELGENLNTDDDIDMSPITIDGNNIVIDIGHKDINKNDSALIVTSSKNLKTYQLKKRKSTCEAKIEIHEPKRSRVVKVTKQSKSKKTDTDNCTKAEKAKTDKESRRDSKRKKLLGPYEKEFMEKLGFKLDIKWFDLDEISKNYDVDVQILTKDEMKKEIADRKTSNNYLNSDFKCDICYLGFMKKYSYDNHMSFHSSDRGSIPCEVCGFMFKSRQKVNTHIRRIHAIVYKCRSCPAVKKCLDRMKMHHDLHQGKRLACKYCDKQFTNFSTRSEHTKKEHSQAQCPICHEKLFNESSVQAHIKLMHGTKKICAPCGTSFQFEAAYNTHLQSLPDGQCDGSSKPCNLCGAHCTTEDELTSHLEKCEKTPKLTLQCPKCPLYFKNNKKLSQHIAWHKMQLNPDGMKKQKYYNPSKNSSHTFVCDICGKSGIPSLNLLLDHQNAHTGETPHKCDYCDKAFKSRLYLKQHRNLHLNIRPYKCHICPKTFAQSAHLHTHIRHHTRETPYECKLCEKKFMHLQSLHDHVKSIHMGVKIVRKRNKRGKKPECDEETYKDKYQNEDIKVHDK